MVVLLVKILFLLLRMVVVVIIVDFIVDGFYVGWVFFNKVFNLLIWGYDIEVFEMMLNFIFLLLKVNLFGFIWLV